MKKIITQLLIILTLLGIIANAHAAPQKDLDRIVAIVDNQPITQTTLTHELTKLKQQIQASQQALPSDEELKQEVLQHLIDTQLQLNIAKQLNLEVPAGQVDETIATIAANNHLSVAQLQDKMRADHVDFAEFKHDIHQQLLLTEVQRHEIMPQIKISDQEIAKTIAAIKKQQIVEYQLQHIYIPTDQISHQRAGEIAAQVRKQLLSQHSVPAQIDGVAPQSEEWGWRVAEQMPESFANAVANLHSGDISAPISADNGYHLLKVIGKRSKNTIPHASEYHVRQIVLKVPNAQSAQPVLSDIQQLRKQLSQGKPFKTLAEQHSQDPNSASKGGDLGWISAQSLPPTLSKTLINLPVGQYSKPVRSPYGWHILEKLAQRPMDNPDSLLHKQAEDLLFKQKFVQALENWIQQLRSEAYIKLFDKS